MKSVKAQIIDSLDWFLAKLKGTFTQKSEIVNNCVSTSTNVPLAAAQGKALSDSISALNSDLSQQISALNSNTVIYKSETYLFLFLPTTEIYTAVSEIYTMIQSK